MMKKVGYKPEFAGAVEAASSSGGQIMPPIMGAAAFLMAEYMGIPYLEVATKAIVPALLYFAGIFIAVHLEAKKLDLKGHPARGASHGQVPAEELLPHHPAGAFGVARVLGHAHHGLRRRHIHRLRVPHRLHPLPAQQLA